MLNTKKFDKKILISIFWVAFTLLFWERTYLLLTKAYELFSQLETPFFFNIIAYICYCLGFFLPAIDLSSRYISFLKSCYQNSIPSKQDSNTIHHKELVINTILRSLKESINSFLIILLIILLVAFVSKVFGSEYLIKQLEMISNIFFSVLMIPLDIIKFSYENEFGYYLYFILAGIPIVYSLSFPSMILVNVAFVMSFPIISSLSIIYFLTKGLWERNKEERHHIKVLK